MSASPQFTEKSEFDGFIAISTDLSEYHEIKEALHESEERLRLALDAANLVVWDLDVKTGQVVYNLPSSINVDQAERFNSLKSIKESFYPDDLKNASILLNQSIKKHQPLYVEHRIMNTDQTYDWWQSSGKTYSDKDGNAVRMIGTTHMITKRKEAELELQKRMHQLQAIYQVADAANKAEDIDAIYREAVEGAKHALEADKVAVFTFDANNELHVAYSDNISEEFQQALLAGCPWKSPAKSSTILYLPDINNEEEIVPVRSYYHAEGIEALAAFPLIHKNQLLGKFVVYYAEPHELTQEDQQFAIRIANHISLATVKAQSEKELVARSYELQTIADTIPDSILRIGSDLKMKFGNKAVLKSTKMTQEEFVGKPATAFGCPEPLHNKWLEMIHTVIEKKKTKKFDFNIEDPETGIQNFHAVIAPEHHAENEEVHSVLAVLRNITEERRLQQTIIDISARQQRRIGQDLHDELGQLLTGIGFKIAGLQYDLNSIDEACATQAKEINKLVEKAISQTRTLAEGLNPVTLEVHGIRAGLEKLALNTESTFGISCLFKCKEDFTIKDEETAVQLYRIGQEAVNNAIKHGNPTKIDIFSKTNKWQS